MSPPFLYFSNTAAEQLILELDEIAERFQLSAFDPIEWLFPDASNCLLMIRLEQSMPREYDDVIRESLAEEVGSAPSAVLRLILNVRRPKQAADAATVMALHLITKFCGVAEDGSDDHLIWTADDIRGGRRGSRFLDQYRADPRRQSNVSGQF
jgi:hypothetical protein